MQWTVKLGVQKQRCNFPPCSRSSSKKAWCAVAAFGSASSKIRFLSLSLGRKHQLWVTHPWQSSLWKCCFSLVALPCHGHQTCPTTPPANCRQDSPIHPIQLSELCISGVSIFLIHHHLCVHTENRSSLAAHSSPVFLPHIATTSCFLMSVAKTFSFASSG